MKNILRRLFFMVLSASLLLCVLMLIFMPIFKAESLIFPYALTPFDICKEYPDTWALIKKLYIIFFLISYCIVYNFLYSNLQNHKESKKPKAPQNFTETYDKNSLNLLVGKDFRTDKKCIFQNMGYIKIF